MGRGSGAVISGHNEVFGIAGCAAAWSRRAVAVVGLGGGVAVADAAGVVIDFLLMRVEGAFAGDFFQVLRPPVCQVDVFGVCGVFWYQIAVADRRRCDAVGGVGAASSACGRGCGAAGAGRGGGAAGGCRARGFSRAGMTAGGDGCGRGDAVGGGGVSGREAAAAGLGGAGGACAGPGSCEHGFGFCQRVELGGMKITGRGQFAEGFLLGLQIGDLGAGEEGFGVVQADLLVFGESAVFLLGLEPLNVAKHLGGGFQRHDLPGCGGLLGGLHAGRCSGGDWSSIIWYSGLCRRGGVGFLWRLDARSGGWCFRAGGGDALGGRLWYGWA